jgi:hypothetical protein
MSRGLIALHSLGRSGNVPEPSLLLASDEASFVAGIVLLVDSGLMAGRQ